MIRVRSKTQCVRLLPTKSFRDFFELLRTSEYNVEWDDDYVFIDQNVYNRSLKVGCCIKVHSEGVYNLSLIPYDRGIEISIFEVYQTGNGLGSKIMNLLNELSYQLNVPLYLIPGTPGGSVDRHDSPERRRRFYHRHGFKRSSVSLYWRNNEYFKKRNEMS